ncbi:hypothetical protein [Nostoc sp. NMS4]|uniref:hypothetical protein n=1 Tax=Nostoc sp. NMS4 TaxID=2815390 RepID=UPI0025D7A446|nr:hypothetical protein [Nostoc sp. NMS4]MBN3927359.1 hypothetical protein [Nostoc sp. NMS4]
MFDKYQRELNSRKGRDNAQSLFKVCKIPIDNQIRNILHPISAIALIEMFDWTSRKLKAKGYLKLFEILSNQLLVILDGSEYFLSKYIYPLR